MWHVCLLKVVCWKVNLQLSPFEEACFTFTGHSLQEHNNGRQPGCYRHINKFRHFHVVQMWCKLFQLDSHQRSLFDSHQNPRCCNKRCVDGEWSTVGTLYCWYCLYQIACLSDFSLYVHHGTTSGKHWYYLVEKNISCFFCGNW